MRWWRWLRWVLGLRRSVYGPSEELRADERRRKAAKRSTSRRRARTSLPAHLCPHIFDGILTRGRYRRCSAGACRDPSPIAPVLPTSVTGTARRTGRCCPKRRPLRSRRADLN